MTSRPYTLLALFLASTFAFTSVARADSFALNAPRHLVFAHYMVCYGSSVEFYKSEIELAQRHGIDGFALNCGNWGGMDAKTHVFQPGQYTQSCERMYEAAKQLNSGFKLMISADVNGLGDFENNMADMVTRFEHHPNQFRYQDKTVLSAWGGNPEAFTGPIEAIRKAGHPVCFIPFLMNSKYAMAWSFETCLKFLQNQPAMDGLFCFLCDEPYQDGRDRNSITRRASLFVNKLYMAGASASYNSANMRDTHGLGGYDAVWTGIVQDDADFVELVTWNDYNEDSNLMPFRWPACQDRPFIDRDESTLDAVGYYSTYYKTGQRPAITQDKLFITYRNRSKWQRKSWDPKTKQFIDVSTTPFPYDQMHDDVADNIYLTGMLTAPAQLSVRIGAAEHHLDLQAGISHNAVPLSPGVPRFLLTRGPAASPTILADVIGRKQIVGEATSENSPINGMHLLNRTWTAAVAVGPATHLDAAGGKLHGHASVQDNAVLNTDEDGSGVTFAVHGLPTATYNLRITYCNSADTEARLTLQADGAARAAQDAPYLLPAFLPPTGKGQFATTSFFWSLYDATTFLTFEHQLSKTDPANSDIGQVLIRSIDLVKVEPAKAAPPIDATIPQLVSIPAGSFTMGSADGNPDEASAHKVTLSAFAIGKNDVTNEQFERFDPTHHGLRDGYSWRNTDPVIYVSWPDAARYCNALSKAKELTPAYDEKTWDLAANSDGYRLPTEAQWEYVATGRGENRAYPWGKEVPDQTRCNMTQTPTPSTLLPARSDPAAGTTVVGSYPTGASRDGVMDLAGNVCQWCQDWLNPYAATDQTDPVSNTTANYRSIRGGSWGYYGGTQRCKAREFNNPNYPGYIYIGFRVMLPEAGYKRLHP